MNIVRSSSGFFFLFLILIAAAGGIWWWLRPYQTQNNQYNNSSVQYYKELEQRYAEDTYGGSTPEETLKLFIAALESGNIDLASKYFVIEKQEEWKKNLEKIRAERILLNMINDLKNAKRGKNQSGKSISFSIVNQDNEVAAILRVVQIPNGKWKISSL